ncbi:MAG TPA: SCO family protein [Anseongella sp.]
MTFLLVAAGITTACTRSAKQLPIYGEKEIVGTDTIYHTIPDFRFLDQDSNWVSNETFEGKVYVADFFFTSCPTICPVMAKNLLTVASHFENNPSVKILSHTIDPRHDSIPALRKYAEKLGANSSQWHFVWGTMDSVHHIAEKGYFATAMEDAEAPGGFMHSGAFILIDGQRRVRGVYDGTIADEVEEMITDMEQLLSSR